MTWAHLPGDEVAVWVRRIVVAVSFIDMGTLDIAAGEPLGVIDRGTQHVPIIRIVRQHLGVQHGLAARRASVGGDDRDLDAEFVGLTGLALADALDLGGMEGIQLPAALTLRL